jgi:hypothetical protein
MEAAGYDIRKWNSGAFGVRKGIRRAIFVIPTVVLMRSVANASLNSIKSIIGTISIP